MGVKVLYRKILHSVEHLAAHFTEKALRYLRHKLCICGYRDYRQYIKPYQSQHHRYNLCPCRCPVAAFVPEIDRLYDLLYEYRRDRRYDRREEYAEHCQRNKHRVASEQLLHKPSEDVFVQLSLRRTSARHFPVRRAFPVHLFIHRRHLRLSAVRRPHGRSGCFQAALRGSPLHLSCRRSSL